MNLDRAAISKLKGPALVKLHNELSDKPVTRFASRADGLKRVFALLADQPVRETPAPAAEPVARSKPAAAIKATKAEAPRPPRPESKRGRFCELLLSAAGVSAAWAQKELGWGPREIGDVLRQTAKKYGWTVTHDEKADVFTAR